MRALAAAAVLLMVSACQAPPPTEPEFTQADRQVIAAEIERLSAESLRSGKPEEMAAFLDYWSESADSYFVTEPALFAQGVRVITTMQALREFFDPARWNRQSTNMSWQSSRVAVLSPEYAVQVGELHFSVTNLEGETGSTFPMSSTTVWVKEDGAWKIMHHHQSWTTDPIEDETEG
jgi:ketosteroid isomerase-like protein